MRAGVIGEATAWLIARLPFQPTVAIVLGSGLGSVADSCRVTVSVPYAEIPGFPPCSVEGHAGRLLVGEWSGARVAILQGRAHRYEGLSLDAVTRPIRILAEVGARTLITTCAAGALGEAGPGDLLLIQDHLNLMGDNPLLAGGVSPEGSSRFVEMAGAYDPGLQRVTLEAAAAGGIVLRQGVLACVPGPSYETPAEAEMLRRVGAQAVSMSVVPEVIVARAMRLRVLGLAVLTNRAGAPLDARAGHHEVVVVAARRAKALGLLLEGVLGRIAAMPDG